MIEEKRKLEQRLVDYLDTKAKNSKVTELRTTKPYATVEEIARKLNSTRTLVTSLIEDLLSQDRIKEFPPSKTKKKFYGSIILPTATKDQVSSKEARRGTLRIYGSEITLNLVMALK